MILVVLLIFFALLSAILFFLYLRNSENDRLDEMALHNLLSEDEKKHYISEYKKILAAKFIYDRMAQPQLAMELTREVVRERRDK